MRTGRLTFACVTVVLLGGAHRVWAQEGGVAAGSGLPLKSLGNDTGVQISDGVYLHGGVGVETGWDSNVLYQNTGAVSSAIIRVVPFLDLNNQLRANGTPPPVSFDLSANLAYRHYFTDDPDVIK